MTVVSKYLRNPATKGIKWRPVMGTITLSIGWEDLISDPSFDFENYLKEVNPKLKKTDRINNKLDKGNNHIIKNGYEKNTHGFVNVFKFIMVSSQPRQFFYPMPAFKITWHQSQWNDQKEVVETFSEIFGIHNAYAILCKGKVLRSDFWLDSELSYEMTKQSSYRPGVSVSDQRKGDRRSYYMGLKGKKVAVFYEKPTNDRSRLDIKFKGNRSIQMMTRYEVRYFGKKVPIRTYSNYIDTSKMELFDHIKTCLFSNEKFLKIANTKKIDIQKIYNFLDVVEKEGLHHARIRFNKSRSFYRTIGPILKEAGKDLKLSKRWQQKVKSKIVGDFDINEYFAKGIENERIKNDK